MKKLTQSEIGEKLQKHDMWLNDEDGGEKADLSDSDLSDSDLDFSCWPLWCGGLNVKIDDRLAIQLLFHTVQNALRSPYVSDDIKRVLGNKEVVDIANRFHREEVARIEPYEEG